MSVSVIVPAFNAELYLREAIESVLVEGDAVGEIIVVDDGSTDGTVALASALPKVTVIAQPNSGIAAARNRAVAASRFAVLAFNDADDLWVAGRLALQLAALEEAKHDALVFGHAEEFVSPDLSPSEQADLRPKPGRHPGYLPGAMIVARATFDRVGGFDPVLPIGETIAFIQRAAMLGVAQRVLPELVLRRRLHRDNFTRAPRHRNAYAVLAKYLLDMKRAGV